jgi:hypothetical protein
MGRLITSRPGFDGDVVEHLGLVWLAVNRLPSYVRRDRGLTDDDLFQAGVLGLLAAKRLFDPGRAKWSTFAYQKARWSMLIAAGLTRSGWEYRPRTLQEWHA